MTKPSNVASIEDATKLTWDEWLEFLDSVHAEELNHTEIAEKVREKLEGRIESAGWWSQGVTVAYEQHIGRREPGQRSDGSYETSVTRTLDGTKDDIFALCLKHFEGVKTWNGKAVSNERTSITPVRSYWRCDLEGGSKVALSVEQKTPNKTMVAIAHTKLESAESKNDWQTFWKDVLDKLEL